MHVRFFRCNGSIWTRSRTNKGTMTHYTAVQPKYKSSLVCCRNFKTTEGLRTSSPPAKCAQKVTYPSVPVISPTATFKDGRQTGIYCSVHRPAVFQKDLGRSNFGFTCSNLRHQRYGTRTLVSLEGNVSSFWFFTESYLSGTVHVAK